MDGWIRTGTVKWCNTAKEFGFIASDQDGYDVFFHFKDVIEFGAACEGERVQYSYASGTKAPQAINIKLLFED